MAQWREFQRFMAKALYRPLTAQSRMQKHWPDGRRTQAVAASFVKPNGRLSSFERLETAGSRCAALPPCEAARHAVCWGGDPPVCQSSS